MTKVWNVLIIFRLYKLFYYGDRMERVLPDHFAERVPKSNKRKYYPCSEEDFKIERLYSDKPLFYKGKLNPEIENATIIL